jgi:hypothetical protein
VLDAAAVATDVERPIGTELVAAGGQLADQVVGSLSWGAPGFGAKDGDGHVGGGFPVG